MASVKVALVGSMVHETHRSIAESLAVYRSELYSPIGVHPQEPDQEEHPGPTPGRKAERQEVS